MPVVPEWWENSAGRRHPPKDPRVQLWGLDRQKHVCTASYDVWVVVQRLGQQVAHSAAFLIKAVQSNVFGLINTIQCNYYYISIFFNYPCLLMIMIHYYSDFLHVAFPPQSTRGPPRYVFYSFKKWEISFVKCSNSGNLFFCYRLISLRALCDFFEKIVQHIFLIMESSSF